MDFAFGLPKDSHGNTNIVAIAVPFELDGSFNVCAGFD